MGLIQFVRNYDDLSTDKGYQFKFYCDKCHNGYLSHYQASVLGTAGSLLQAAGSLFGGFLGQAGNSAYQVQRAVGGKAHDSAIEEAVNEVKPKFTQCARCGHWVCNEICWNDKRGLCTECAPKTEVEVAAAQSAAQVEQIRTQVAQKDQTAGLDLDAQMVARCPKCKAQLTGGKFCGECGEPLVKKDTCSGCHAKLAPGAKFCAECGQKQE